MNKFKHKAVAKCKLKQTDIFTAFKKWKFIKKEKDMKRYTLSTEVIVIEDSDDSDSESIKTNLPKRKRPLAQPFSDDEDKQVSGTAAALSTNQPTLKKEVTSEDMPETKRPLSYSFFDDDLEESHSPTGCGNETISSTSHGTLEHPIACSTPFLSNFRTSNNLNSHVNHNNLDVSQIEIDSTSYCSSASTTVSERTIIMEQNLSPKKKVKILHDIIVPLNNSSFHRNTTIIAQNSSCTETIGSSNKEVCVEQERNTTTSTTCKSEKWLSKENKPDCNKNKRKNENPRQQVSKSKCVVEDNNGQRAVGNGKVQKSHDSKKDLSQIDNTLKVSMKDNTHNYAKDGNTHDRNNDLNKTKSVVTDRVLGDNISSNQNSICREKNSGTVLRCDKTGNSSSSSPKKNLTRENSSPGISCVAKKEDRRMNKELLISITDLFKTVFSCKHVNNLLHTEKKLIRMFIEMDVKWQYACLKLITRKWKWYNAFKFCRLIYLDMEDTDICNMVNTFERNRIVDTNYEEESIMHLLQLLDKSDLRCICDKFRIKRTLKTKEEMIKHLLKYADTQSTLTVHKSTKDLLLEEVQRRMGRCIRVSKAFKNAFDSTFTLATFTNHRFTDISVYSKIILSDKVVFPTFPIDEYTIFSSRTDFIRFAKAKEYRDKLEVCTDHVIGWHICNTIFQELRDLENDKSDIERFQDAPHLTRYTAKAVYVSTLSSMIEKLYSKYPKDVKMWLEYMIKKVDCAHKIGRWYYHLIWLYMKYLEPINYDHAAALLIEVLHQKKQDLFEVQLYHLRQRGDQLIRTKKYKIDQMNHDCIAQLLPRRIKVEDFPEITIDAKDLRSNEGGQRRTYEIRDSEGNKTIFNVEDYALKHYLEKLHYTDGEHWEGAFVKATFTLFFFDIIYSSKNSIPGTFVSKLQSEPLDMYSRYFYLNRREQIDKRLREIGSEWSDTELIEFLTNNYEKHSHEYAVCEVGVVVKDISLLKILVECIGRKVLAKIFERLVKSFKEYGSGLPDLLVWNVDKKICKFVEVKSENDKLSMGQILWLNYLNKIGANIEVCHVHSIGSKRKLKKVNKNLPQASTSSSSSGEVAE